MRRTFSKSGLLIGCALALGAAGCSDDGGGNNNPTDSGTNDTGVPTDSGTDSGTADAGTDTGVDAGPILPVQLRLAHLAFGSSVGPAHVCARTPSGSSWLLLTTDGLGGGTTTGPLAIPYGTITKHVVISPTQLAALAGMQIEIYRASEAGAAYDTTFQVGTCTPTAPPLATAALGSGVGQIALVPGGRHTVVVTGASGAEFNGVCPSGVCLPPAIVALNDEETSSSTTTTRLRTFLADPRFSLAPGVCTYDYTSNATTAVPVMASGIVALASPATVPAYSDESPLGPTVLNDGDGGLTVIPKLFSLHMAGTAGDPCVVVTDPDAGLPMMGVIGAGILPNQGLIDAFASNPLAAVIQPGMAPGDVTTLFIAPQLLEFRDVSMPVDGGQPPLCAPGSSATCQPLPCATPSATCTWIPMAMPVDDSQ